MSDEVTLETLIGNVDKDIEQSRKYYQQRLGELEKEREEKLALVQKNYAIHRQLAALAEDLAPHIYSWDTLTSMTIKVGVRPRSKKKLLEFTKKFRDVRKVLGVPLKKAGVRIYNAKRKLIEVDCEAVGLPVTVSYIRKLSPNDPCKIVKTRRRATDVALVCQAVPSAPKEEVAA